MFGAGCFWGVESYFQQLPGVIETAVGYSGGTTDNPTYKQICTDTTGHAEVIHIVFDPATITYETLVRHFFHMHDPTQLNRQGPDYGRQYRSAIFTYSDAQRDTAITVRDALTAKKKYARPIVTEVTPAKTFWKAEDYHQKYFDKNGGESCHIAPDGELD
jgi:peptide-methionine (S)-S-oxide reductase